MTITIKIDTREQQPYRFKNLSEVGTITLGDYFLFGLEKHTAIERKEINDLIGCLSADRERFERELHKARTLDYSALRELQKAYFVNMQWRLKRTLSKFTMILNNLVKFRML
jgi:hypothetical protein